MLAVEWGTGGSCTVLGIIEDSAQHLSPTLNSERFKKWKLQSKLMCLHKAEENNIKIKRRHLRAKNEKQPHQIGKDFSPWPNIQLMDFTADKWP